MPKGALKRQPLAQATKILSESRGEDPEEKGFIKLYNTAAHCNKTSKGSQMLSINIPEKEIQNSRA